MYKFVILYNTYMKKKISVFGGTRCVKEKEPYYFNLAYQTGKLLAEAGYTVLTGGGPGLMNETLRGAFENGGETIGVMLELEGITHSPYFTEKYIFDKLVPRQDKLIQLADGYITLPGGMGTLFETVEILTLKNVKEIPVEKPLILVDDYYKDLDTLFSKIIKEGFIREDLHTNFQLVSCPEDAITILNNALKTTISTQ